MRISYAIVTLRLRLEYRLGGTFWDETVVGGDEVVADRPKAGLPRPQGWLGWDPHPLRRCGTPGTNTSESGISTMPPCYSRAPRKSLIHTNGCNPNTRRQELPQERLS